MKNLFILSVFVFSIFSCEKEDLPLKTMEWTLTGEFTDTPEVIHSFESDQRESIRVIVKTESLCPNTGVGFEILEDGEVVFEKIAKNFPFGEVVPISKKSTITVNAKLEDGEGSEPASACVWLGEATFRLEY